MERISNKSIAMLLIATIAVYLGGTFISLSRLSEFGAMGFATDEPNTPGNVSVTVTSTTSITWTAAIINWGSGYVGACSNCTLFTNGTNTTPSSNWGTHFADCCTGFTRWNQSLLLKNDGNNNVSLQMNVTDNASMWFGVAYTPKFLGFKIVEESTRAHDLAVGDDIANSCTTNTTWNGYKNVPGDITNWNGWTTLENWTSATMKFICGDVTYKGFSSRTTENEANFDFIVTVPQTYPGSSIPRSTMITILATS